MSYFASKSGFGSMFGKSIDFSRMSNRSDFPTPEWQMHSSQNRKWKMDPENATRRGYVSPTSTELLVRFGQMKLEEISSPPRESRKGKTSRHQDLRLRDFGSQIATLEQAKSIEKRELKEQRVDKRKGVVAEKFLDSYFFKPTTVKSTTDHSTITAKRLNETHATVIGLNKEGKAIGKKIDDRKRSVMYDTPLNYLNL